MKIAQIAPVWERVPPAKYGGIELVVHLLTEELVDRGHDVTLFASGNSKTEAELVSVYAREQRGLIGRAAPDLLHVASALLKAARFDIVHNHAGYSGVSLANFVETPVLSTLHGIFTPTNTPLFQAFAHSCYYNSISDEQRRSGPVLNYAGTVYNAIDVDSFPFSREKKDYVFLVSRMTRLKGIHVAIRVAKKAGVKLVLAGKIDPGADRVYFEEKVRPFLDHEHVVFLHEVSEGRKRKLLRDARAFLFPLQWSEPFGLVMVEAMACGTPVISFPKGAVPEVVVHGKTGFLAETEDEMVGFVQRIGDINPEDCRRHVEKRFSVSRMVDDYERLYARILEQRSTEEGAGELAEN
ncbi:MAG: glycosyltransferase family 4 protein [Terriglobia bacterium]